MTGVIWPTMAMSREQDAHHPLDVGKARGEKNAREVAAFHRPIIQKWDLVKDDEAVKGAANHAFAANAKLASDIPEFLVCRPLFVVGVKQPAAVGERFAASDDTGGQP